MSATSDRFAGASQAYGIPYDPYFDKYDSLWQIIGDRNAPSDRRGCSWDSYGILVTLVARRILYYKKTPGDCGSTTTVSPSNLATGLKYGGLGIGTASSVSTLALGATAGLSVGLGVATAGVGLILAPIMGILQHHQQAVANEQATVCAVATASAQAIPQVDALVKSGQITAKQGIDAMTLVVQQLTTALQPILKGCNAACCYIAELNAHLDFARIYYMDISPSQSPVTSPAAYTGLKPGSIIRQQADTLLPPPGSPVVSTRISSWVWMLGILIAVIGALVFLRK
jgi:hypothetical protein